MRGHLLLITFAIISYYASGDLGDGEVSDATPAIIGEHDKVDERGGWTYGGKKKASRSSYQSKSVQHHHVYKPNQRPALMDTSYECCKDILEEISEVNTEVGSVTARLAASTRLLTRETALLQELLSIAESNYDFESTNVAGALAELVKLLGRNEDIYASFLTRLQEIVVALMN